jgi:hypothetical protein
MEIYARLLLRVSLEDKADAGACSRHLQIPCNVAAGEAQKKGSRKRRGPSKGRERKPTAAAQTARVFRLPPLLGRRLNLGFRLDKKGEKRARGNACLKLALGKGKERGKKGGGGGDRRRNRATRQCPSTGAGALLTGTHLSSNAPTRGIYLLAQLIGLRE